MIRKIGRVKLIWQINLSRSFMVAVSNKTQNRKVYLQRYDKWHEERGYEQRGYANQFDKKCCEMSACYY